MPKPADLLASGSNLDRHPRIDAHSRVWATAHSGLPFLLERNAPILKGRDALRAWAQPYCDQFDMEETITLQEAEIIGDWAFARTKYIWRVTPKAGGETVEEVGKSIGVLKRQSDGSWKIARTIWNSDNPPQPIEPTT